MAFSRRFEGTQFLVFPPIYNRHQQEFSDTGENKIFPHFSEIKPTGSLICFGGGQLVKDFFNPPLGIFLKTFVDPKMGSNNPLKNCGGKNGPFFFPFFFSVRGIFFLLFFSPAFGTKKSGIFRKKNPLLERYKEKISISEYSIFSKGHFRERGGFFSLPNLLKLGGFPPKIPKKKKIFW